MCMLPSSYKVIKLWGLHGSSNQDVFFYMQISTPEDEFREN